MSTFFSFVYPDRVQLLTDGAHLDRDGNLIGIGRKVFTLPRLPMAFTGRGSMEDLTTILRDMEIFVDEMVIADSVDVVLMAIRGYFSTLKERGLFFNAEILIAAFSEDDGPCHFYVDCTGDREIPAFELTNPGWQICGGTGDLRWEDLAHLALDADDLASPDFPALHGISIMEAIRGKTCQPPGMSGQLYTVGGLCDLTTVTAAGAVTRTLCKWADEMGKPIDPATGYASALAEAAE